MNDRADEIERAIDVPKPGGLVAVPHRCEMRAVLDVADASRITKGAGSSSVHPHVEEP